MKVEAFLRLLKSEFYTGVPDSQLKSLCDYLFDKYGLNGTNHIIAANEGNAVALAAGYHLSTGKIPVVYMQNSGEGNAVNPITSLMNDKVYGIPCIFIIGWRGEPGVHDEPQHVFQGEITCKLLELLNIQYMILDKNTSEKDVIEKIAIFENLLNQGKQVAFVVKKEALEFDKKIKYTNSNEMVREEIIKQIVDISEGDFIVSTTGKASRELFEIREANKENHGYDFLTVGSMGHSSSIALEIALQKPKKRIWIIDGDGAALMHLGSMAVLGSYRPKNIVHVLINNGCHETVGGQPTVLEHSNVVKIAEGCGYPNVKSVNTLDLLKIALKEAKSKNELSFIEVKCAIGSRGDLGRPTTTAAQNKECFMKTLKKDA